MGGVTMRKKIVVGLLGAGLLLGAAAFVAAHWRQQGPIPVGGKAPDFALPALGRAPVALSDYRRQVVVLNFWATWCPPCVEETPSLERFSAQMARRGVAVIGVSVDQDNSALEKFVASYHLSFPIGRDPEQALAARFGTSRFPETYVLDRDSRVAEKLIGSVDWQDPRIISFVETLAGSPGPETP
jgi:peroxiredoxin